MLLQHGRLSHWLGLHGKTITQVIMLQLGHLLELLRLSRLHHGHRLHLRHSHVRRHEAYLNLHLAAFLLLIVHRDRILELEPGTAVKVSHVEHSLANEVVCLPTLLVEDVEPDASLVLS